MTDLLLLAALFFVPAVLAYAVLRLVSALFRVRAGFGLIIDSSMLLAMFGAAFALLWSELTPKSCIAFFEFVPEGLLSVLAFVPSFPRIRKVCGPISPFIGLGLAVIAIGIFYWFAPEDMNPRNCL